MMRPRVALTPDQTIYDALLFHINMIKLISPGRIKALHAR